MLAALGIDRLASNAVSGYYTVAGYNFIILFSREKAVFLSSPLSLFEPYNDGAKTLAEHERKINYYLEEKVNFVIKTEHGELSRHFIGKDEYAKSPNIFNGNIDWYPRAKSSSAMIFGHREYDHVSKIYTNTAIKLDKLDIIKFELEEEKLYVSAEECMKGAIKYGSINIFKYLIKYYSWKNTEIEGFIKLAYMSRVGVKPHKYLLGLLAARGGPSILSIDDKLIKDNAFMNELIEIGGMVKYFYLLGLDITPGLGLLSIRAKKYYEKCLELKAKKPKRLDKCAKRLGKGCIAVLAQLIFAEDKREIFNMVGKSFKPLYPYINRAYKSANVSRIKDLIKRF